MSGHPKPITREERDNMIFGPHELAEAISRKRAIERLSMRELAEICNVTDKTIGNYERGNFPVAAARVLSWLYKGGYDITLAKRVKTAEATLKLIQIDLIRYERGMP